ncbi:MAG: transposase [Erythrobacter sp.]|nr:transposase [Erythrobacter sp.]
MPRIIPSDETSAHGLEDCLEMLDSVPFEPEDEDSLGNGAVALKRLANNSHFLGDLLIEQLKVGHRGGGIESAYGPQSIVLSRMRGRSFLRANIWPSEQESCFRASGSDAFVYGVPHDHNFSFLTAGYFGPGYGSDYYEYDYESVAGYRGEVCDLRFVERTHLEEGKLMLYRANLDIHSQLPPENMSVSLNIMHIDPAKAWSDQYGFDLDSNAVTGVLNPTSTECSCAVRWAWAATRRWTLPNGRGANIPATGSGWRVSRRAAGWCGGPHATPCGAKPSYREASCLQRKQRRSAARSNAPTRARRPSSRGKGR